MESNLVLMIIDYVDDEKTVARIIAASKNKW